MRRTKYEYHGMSGHQMYTAWQHMKERCYVENTKKYNDYGGRGIKMCDSWKDSFLAFYEDMKGSYVDGLEIDRIDNGGDYTKENCRWVTRNVNVSNRRYKSRFMMGVDKTSKNSRYRAKITVFGVQYIIGRFNTEIEAHNAFMEVRKEWYGK